MRARALGDKSRGEGGVVLYVMHRLPAVPVAGRHPAPLPQSRETMVERCQRAAMMGTVVPLASDASFSARSLPPSGSLLFQPSQARRGGHHTEEATASRGGGRDANAWGSRAGRKKNNKAYKGQSKSCFLFFIYFLSFCVIIGSSIYTRPSPSSSQPPQQRPPFLLYPHTQPLQPLPSLLFLPLPPPPPLPHHDIEHGPEEKREERAAERDDVEGHGEIRQGHVN